MQHAEVKGWATSTVKHASMLGQRLLVCQPLGEKLNPLGDPVLALDRLGAGVGDRVILTSDGAGIREMVKSKHSPVRWWTLGIVDE